MLFNDRATADVYYKLKYATTAQQDVENGTADVLAQFKKKLLAEKADGPLQDVDTATRRVLSMAYSSSSRMQVPAPLAAVLVLGYPGKICSHSFGCFLLAQALHRMHGESISGVLRLRTQRRLNGDVVGDSLDGQSSRVVGSRAGSGVKSREGGGKTVREVVAVDSFTEYACRPTVLSSLNWYQFVEVSEQVKLPPSVVAADLSRLPAVDADDLSDASTEQDPAERSSTMRYLGEHPLYHSHGFCRRRQRCVPRIYGPRLPDRELLVDADQQGTYGMIALLLFAPWRSCDDLVAEGEFWWASCARTVFDSASIVLMDVMQSWFETNNEADRAAAEKAAMGGGSAEGGCDAASDADRADEQMGNGDGFGDGGPLDFAEAAKVCAAGGMEDVQNASQLPRDPLVVRLPSSGALGLLSSALCRAAAAFLCVASKAALGWSGMIQSGQGLDVDASDVTTADAPPPVSSCDRIDPAVVEKEAAALCSRIRSGEVLDEVGDGTCEAADDSNGDPTFASCVTVETLADSLADVTQPLRVAGVSAETPVDPPPCLSIGAVGSVFSFRKPTRRRSAGLECLHLRPPLPAVNCCFMFAVSGALARRGSSRQCRSSAAAGSGRERCWTRPSRAPLRLQLVVRHSILWSSSLAKVGSLLGPPPLNIVPLSAGP